MSETKKISWDTLFLLGILVSFVGWIYETLLFYILYGGMHDRGFVTLPFCPIYGITIVIIYLIIGTPHAGGFLLSRFPGGGGRMVVYYLLAALIPSVSEFVGGELMEMLTGEVLWSYEAYEYNIGKYACLEIAFIWGLAILLFMCFFDKLLKLISRIQKSLSRRIAFSLSALITFDFIGNLILRI